MLDVYTSSTVYRRNSHPNFSRGIFPSPYIKLGRAYKFDYNFIYSTTLKISPISFSTPTAVPSLHFFYFSIVKMYHMPQNNRMFWIDHKFYVNENVFYFGYFGYLVGKWVLQKVILNDEKKIYTYIWKDAKSQRGHFFPRVKSQLKATRDEGSKERNQCFSISYQEIGDWGRFKKKNAIKKKNLTENQAMYHVLNVYGSTYKCSVWKSDFYQPECMFFSITKTRFLTVKNNVLLHNVFWIVCAFFSSVCLKMCNLCIIFE